MIIIPYLYKNNKAGASALALLFELLIRTLIMMVPQTVADFHQQFDFD